MNNAVTSSYVKQGNTSERRARLLAGSQSDVERLEMALAQGYDVADMLAVARRSVAALSR